MNLVIPENKSVVIFTSYRTGSTALCDYISKKYKLVNFDEVLHVDFSKRLENFKAFLTSHNKFVIKIMPDQITNSNIEFINQLVTDSFLIKLERKNIIEQITSFYLCCETGNWHFTKFNNMQEYTVEIKPENFDYLIKYILNNNKNLNKLDYQYHLKLYYEDINNIDSQYRIYQKPSNHLALTNAIKQKLTDYT
jgi:hypothetical protein